MSSKGQTSNYSDALNILSAMGFDQSQALSALDIANGDAEYAANYLLSGGGSIDESRDNNEGRSTSIINDFMVAQSTTGSTGDIEQIQGTISQYSHRHGRSACTFIALSTASAILHTASHKVSINQSFLDDMIKGGCDNYTEWTRKQRSEETQDHTSVEEILEVGYYPSVKLFPGGIQQGMLTNDQSDPLGLYACLLSCQSLTECICVVMIKPPETILLYLPPKSTRTSETNDSINKYYLVDSHPRMTEFGTEHAYCRIHVSLIDLVQSISTIFPVTNLGSDVPEYMSSMYNSYDLYALHSVTK